ncbi:hypothetical protein QYM36_013181, partial [Artemia franciscana]
MERKPGDSLLYVVLFVTLFIHYPVHGLIQMPRSLRLKDEHQVHTEVIEASCDHLYRDRAYHRVRRTLCPEDLEVSNASEELEFVVGVSTSDPRNVSFTIEATKIDDFLINRSATAEVSDDQIPVTYGALQGSVLGSSLLDEERNIIVSPSEPEFYQYVFDENVTAVLVNVTSPDDLCMTVSVQNLTCPSFGRDEEMRYDSIRQTALDRSGLTIT